MCFRTGSYSVYIPIHKLRFVKGEADLKVSRVRASKESNTTKRLAEKFVR